jgi:hypothetical protein
MVRRIALVLMLPLANAAADPAPVHRAALAAIDLSPDIPSYIRTKAILQIEEGLAAAGYVVLPTAQVAPRLTGDLVHCREGACIREVGTALGVDSVVFTTITNKADSSIVTMRLYDAITNEQIADVHEICDLCGEAELVERLSVAASELRARAEQARETKTKLAPPPVIVAPSPAVIPTRAAPEPRSLLPGIVAGSVGVAAIASGIYLLALDGRGTCHAGDEPEYPEPGAVIRYPDPGDRSTFVCKQIYKTKPVGIATAGVGIAALAAGVVLVIRARTGDRTLEVTPQPGGATVGASWTW